MSTPTARLLRCPGCGKLIRYDLSNPVRPFCSPLCKAEDIAGWADERHRIAGEPTSDLPTPAPAAEDDEPS